MWLGQSFPSGWWICDGSTVSVGGTPYTMPNLSGRFPVGASSTNSTAVNSQTNSCQFNGLSFYDVGDIGGEETHTLSSREIPYHTHNFSYENAIQVAGTGGQFGNWQTQYGVQFKGVTDGGTTGDSAHNNLPPYVAMAFIMKLSDTQAVTAV